MNKRKATAFLVICILLATWILPACSQNTFIISYEVNGGSFLAPQDVLSGEIAEKPQDPVKEGYNFDGWYLKKNFATGTEYLFDSPVVEDITLYAKWSRKTVYYTVTFNTMGGEAIASQQVESGQSATKPQNPTKADYTFAGWYRDIAGTVPYLFGAVGQDLTVYAKWTVNSGVAVYIDKSSAYLQQQAAMSKTVGDDAYADRSDLFTYVGDDNDYILPIVLKDIGENPVSDDHAVQVQVKRDGAVLDDSFYEANGSKIKFKQPAIGSTVSIEASLGEETVTFPNVKVIDGYNVYSAADLANVTHTIHVFKGTVTILRAAKIQTAAILLHNNLNIVNEDFDGVNVFETAAPGAKDEAAFKKLKNGKALRDNVYLYVLAAGKTSNVNYYEVGEKMFVGNYFTIDLTELAPVVRDDGKEETLKYDDNQNIMNTIDNSSYMFRILNQNDYILKNLNVVGNSGVPDAASAFRNNGGCGIIELNGGGTEVTINNVNSKFAVSFLSVSMRGNDPNKAVTLSNSKAINGFSQTIYVSISTLNIKNCVLKDCGGPILYLASAVPKAENPQEIGFPKVTVDEKTVLENWVTGSEAWFKINDAEQLATALTASGEGSLTETLNVYDRTILQRKGQVDCFNFIAITLDIYHFGDQEEAFKFYSYSDVTFKNSSDPSKSFEMNHNPGDAKFQTVTKQLGVPSLIKTSAGGYAGFPKELCELFGLDFDENNAKCEAGAYLNMETDIGVMFGGKDLAGMAGTLSLITGYYPRS